MKFEKLIKNNYLITSLHTMKKTFQSPIHLVVLVLHRKKMKKIFLESINL